MQFTPGPFITSEADICIGRGRKVVPGVLYASAGVLGFLRFEDIRVWQVFFFFSMLLAMKQFTSYGEDVIVIIMMMIMVVTIVIIIIISLIVISVVCRLLVQIDYILRG